MGTTFMNLKKKIPSWNEKFELTDGLYSVLDFKDYFDYIFKKYREKPDNSSVRIYVNNMENRMKVH